MTTCLTVTANRNRITGPQVRRAFDILRWLHTATDEALLVEEGSLYPALHRMERRGWIEPEWGVSEKGRRAKYYGLTRAGRHELVRQEQRWLHYVAVVGKVIAASATG